MYGLGGACTKNRIVEPLKQECLRPGKRLKVTIFKEEDNDYNKGELPGKVTDCASINGGNPVMDSDAFIRASIHTVSVRPKPIPYTNLFDQYFFGYRIDHSDPLKVHIQQGVFKDGVLMSGIEETFEYYHPSEQSKNSISIYIKKEGLFCDEGFLVQGVKVSHSDPGTALEEINYQVGFFYERGGGLKYGSAAIKLPAEEELYVCEGEFNEIGSLANTCMNL